jgi:hypothetical protein
MRVLAVVLVVAAIVAGAWWGREMLRPANHEGAPASGPEITLPGPQAMWVNGPPLPPDSLRDHLVALVIWTESEPLSLELLPEAEAWHRAYARHGVRVVGIHAPSFAFGADTSVTAGVARRLGLTFPIVLDPSYEVSGGPGVPESRPAVVVVNRDGRALLSASGGTLSQVDYQLRRAILAADQDAGLPLGDSPPPASPRSQRLVHLGVSRVEHGPLAGRAPGEPVTFTAQFRFQEEGDAYVPYVVGRWIPEIDGVIAARGGAANYVSIRYDGGDAWAVLSPPETNDSRLWILADDEWLTREEAGDDVGFDPRGAAYLLIDRPRIYSIARTRSRRVLKLSPESPGVTFHSLVFEAPRARP